MTAMAKLIAELDRNLLRSREIAGTLAEQMPFGESRALVASMVDTLDVFRRFTGAVGEQHTLERALADHYADRADLRRDWCSTCEASRDVRSGRCVVCGEQVPEPRRSLRLASETVIDDMPSVADVPDWSAA